MNAFWERLVLAVASTVLAAALVGIWVSGISLMQNQAVIQSQLKDVRALVQGVYTQRDAKKDFAAVWKTDKDQYEKLVDHEQRIRALEAQDLH